MANQTNGRAISKKTFMLVNLGVLTAIVFILQQLAIATRPLFPVFSISLVLIPITIGAALIGTYAGGWLGLAFGFAVLISGDAGLFFAANPIGTVVVVLVKGLLAGIAAGAVYKLVIKKSKNGDRTIAAALAGITCPIVNTGIFIIGSYIFFLPTITEWGENAGFASQTAYIFLGLVGINFLVELGLNLVMIPVIVRLIKYGQDKKYKV